MQTFFHIIGYGFCHQLPSRCLFSGGYCYPLCARCTGIYLGLAFSLIALFLIYRRRPLELPPKRFLVLLLAGIAFMAFDGFSSYLGLRESNNALRFFSGFSCAAPLGAYLFWASSYCLGLRCAPCKKASLCPRRFEDSQPGLPLLGQALQFCLWLGSSAAFAAAFYALSDKLGFFGPLLCALSIPFVLCVLIATVLDLWGKPALQKGNVGTGEGGAAAEDGGAAAEDGGAAADEGGRDRRRCFLRDPRRILLIVSLCAALFVLFCTGKELLGSYLGLPSFYRLFLAVCLIS